TMTEDAGAFGPSLRSFVDRRIPADVHGSLGRLKAIPASGPPDFPAFVPSHTSLDAGGARHVRAHFDFLSDQNAALTDRRHPFIIPAPRSGEIDLTPFGEESNMVRTTIAVTLIAGLGLLMNAGLARAQDQPELYAKPLPQHEMLKKEVGTWDATMNLFMGG